MCPSLPTVSVQEGMKRVHFPMVLGTKNHPKSYEILTPGGAPETKI